MSFIHHPTHFLGVYKCNSDPLQMFFECTQATKDKRKKFRPLKSLNRCNESMNSNAPGDTYFCRRRRHRILHRDGGLWCAPQSPAPRTAPCRSGHTRHHLHHEGHRIRQTRTCFNRPDRGQHIHLMALNVQIC